MLKYADAEYAGIKTVGIPRALLYYRYGTFFEAFFAGLGIETILSPETDRGIVLAGERYSVDETCLALKIYMGHVAYLLDQGKCDAVFVGGISSNGDSRDYCTRFQSLPDLVANTFNGRGTFVTCLVNKKVTNMGIEETYTGLAMRFGFTEKQARKIVRQALKEQESADKAKAHKQQKALTRLERAQKEKDSSTPLSVLLVAHPYVEFDDYLGASIVKALEEGGATVFSASQTKRKETFKSSYDFSKTMPWEVNRELTGAILKMKDTVDGIVLVSAFPCGPDSMTIDAIMRCITGKPMLSLTIDAQSGTAGLQTRIESFLDILEFQHKGGYL